MKNKLLLSSALVGSLALASAAVAETKITGSAAYTYSAFSGATAATSISAVADNFEVRNAKTIKIQANKKISFELLYDKNNSLHKKIKIEQTRKETSSN